MLSRLSLPLMISACVSVALCSLSISTDPPPPCSLILSELQLAAPLVHYDFIELRTNSTLPCSLSSYTLLLWHGNKKDDKGQKTILLRRAQFSTTNNTNCTILSNSSYLVIGSPNVPVLNNAQLCTFDEFGADWPKEKDGYINKGNMRTNALVLYRDLSSTNMTINVTELTSSTAHRDAIVDLLFFAKNGKHGLDVLHLLFPDYHVGPSPANIYFRLEDKDTNTINTTDKHSFSFCCRPENVSGKWPMGFKWTLSSPGDANNCSGSAYVMDAEQKNYPHSLDRCDVSAVTNYFSTTTRMTAPAVITTTASPVVPGKSTGKTVGLALGITMAILLAAFVSLVLLGRWRKRHYGQFGQHDSGTCFPLWCLQAREDHDRLVLDN